MARIVSDRKEPCGCRRCGTYARITKWSCDCIQVSIYNDKDPCKECTDFSGKRHRCGQPGHPENHRSR
jgi:hypothetical protein